MLLFAASYSFTAASPTSMSLTWFEAKSGGIYVSNLASILTPGKIFDV